MADINGTSRSEDNQNLSVGRYMDHATMYTVVGKKIKEKEK